MGMRTMAPAPSSQKGAGKKAGIGGNMRGAQPRSRNTTPSASSAGPAMTANLPPIDTVITETLGLQFELFRNLFYDDLVDSSASSSLVPESIIIDGIISRLITLGEIVERRGNYFDRGMRLMAERRKQAMSEMSVVRGVDDERDEDRDTRKANKKKRKATETLAPQAASRADQSSPVRESSTHKRAHSRDADTASSSLSPVTPNVEPDDKNRANCKDKEDSGSEDEGRLSPSLRPQANTFGDDPSTFPDSTVYDIRPVEPGMSEDEIREIYSVATHPKSDLADLIAGDPPDKDFSNAKPANQINFSTFSSYVEPYFRPFTEEDLAFLRERGDRVSPFVMPRRGKKHYTELWAEEDGAMIDSSLQGPDKLPPNQSRGSIENMDDTLAESDKLSVGPLLSRLLQAMRPENRAPPAEDRAMTNGDVDSAFGSASFDFSFGDSTPATLTNGISGASGAINGAGHGEQSLPPATHMLESNSDTWKKATHPKLDYAQVDERLKQELRHIGFLPLTASEAANSGAATVTDPSLQADYDGHFDDDIAARLRLLQDRLREQVLVNGTRKQKLTELVKSRMAYQEYQTILEDLDSQVNAAYLKRTRTMGKKPKKNRLGVAAAASALAGINAGMARPGIGDMTKTLMERRRRWIESIGTVFDGENLSKVHRSEDINSSIFKPEEMAGLLKSEKEAWDEEVDEEA